MFNNISQYIVYNIFGLTRGSKLGAALDFFLYDTAKILILLLGIIFLISFIRSFFPPERTRKILARKGEFAGNVLAALLGVATPFCSCSAVPLFIGFVEGGVPLGVTFSFLISSPMVNEVAIVLLWGLFGWKITAIYIGTGLCVAIIGGFIIGRLKLEKWVQEYVYQIHLGETDIGYPKVFKERLEYAKATTKEILGKIWPWVVGAIAVGAFFSWLRTGGFSRPLCRRRQLVCCPIGRTDRSAALLKCGRSHPYRLYPYEQGNYARYSPGFYDGGHSPFPSRDDNPAPGPENKTACDLCRDYGDYDHWSRLFIQCNNVRLKCRIC